MLEDIPENQLTDRIINAAIEVHKTLGPGLKEEVYEAALALELDWRGFKCQRQVPVQVTYKGIDIGEPEHPKRIDLLVEDTVVVECKALPAGQDPLFKAQCLTYLKMTGKRVGLVMNFGRPTMKEGISRVFNETREEYRARLARENPEALKRVLEEEDGAPA
jgi:GxxExxY protein